MLKRHLNHKIIYSKTVLDNKNNIQNLRYDLTPHRSLTLRVRPTSLDARIWQKKWKTKNCRKKIFVHFPSKKLFMIHLLADNYVTGCAINVQTQSTFFKKFFAAVRCQQINCPTERIVKAPKSQKDKFGKANHKLELNFDRFLNSSLRWGTKSCVKVILRKLGINSHGTTFAIYYETSIFIGNHLFSLDP